jgi:hypothetical protein
MATEQLIRPPAGALEIEIFGSELNGLQIIERTKILSIHREGAVFPLAHKLAPESELIVRNPATNEEALARVLDLIYDDVCVHVYGVAFIDPAANPWHLEFPDRQPPVPVNLACSRCQTVEAVSLGEIEEKILESRKVLTRPCKCVRTSTIWKKTDRLPAPQGTATREEARPPAARSNEDRRQYKRTAMKAAACVRIAKREIIVQCEDVSRGGFRFKSSESFPVGTKFEAAVPYAKGSMNIFVQCQVAYHCELSANSFRHGVAYLGANVIPGSRSKA